MLNWKFILFGLLLVHLYHAAQQRNVTQPGPGPMPADVTTLGGSW